MCFGQSSSVERLIFSRIASLSPPHSSIIALRFSKWSFSLTPKSSSPSLQSSPRRYFGSTVPLPKTFNSTGSPESLSVTVTKTSFTQLASMSSISSSVITLPTSQIISPVNALITGRESVKPKIRFEIASFSLNL